MKFSLFNEIDGQVKVTCTSFGGRPLSMSLTGPSGEPKDIMNQSTAVGVIEGTGNDSFSAEISLKGGRSGDTYTCAASNIVSNSSILQGIHFC